MKTIQYDGFNIEELAQFMGERDWAIDSNRNVYIGSVWLKAGYWAVKVSGRLMVYPPEIFKELNKKKTTWEALRDFFGAATANEMRKFPLLNRRINTEESFLKRRVNE